jgi:Protein of unknown function
VSEAPRQALVGGGRRWTLRLLALGLLAALVGVGALSWRLSRQPLPLPLLARIMEERAADAAPGLRLRVGGAALGWQGFHRGFGAPLDLRLSDIRILAGTAGTELEVPAAEVALSLPALLGGRLAPAAITLHRPRLRAVLGPDGRIALGPLGAAAASEAGSDPLAVLAVLLHPAHDDGRLARLRRVTIAGGEAVLADPGSGRDWALLEPAIELRRTLAGGLTASGQAVFRAGTQSVPIELAGTAGGSPLVLTGRMRLPALRPAALAQIWPGLAPLAALDAEVALSASASFDAALKPVQLGAVLQSGPGSLAIGLADPRRPPARLRIQGFEATLEGSARQVAIRAARLRLPGAEGQPGPVLAAQMHGERQADGGWRAQAEASAEPFRLADLRAFWPADLYPALRPQALAALAGGTLGPAKLTLGLAMPPGLNRLVLGDSAVTLAGQDLVLAIGKEGRVQAAGLDLAARFDGEKLRLDRLAVRLPPPVASGGAPPLVQATATAERRAGRWQIAATAELDQANVLDAAQYWPPGLVDGSAREWVLENITSGVLRQGRWQATASLPESLDAFEVTGLSGKARFENGAVHWLRPVPPIIGVSGEADFQLREIVVHGRGGRQLGADGMPSGLAVPDGTVRLYNFHIRPGNIALRGRMTGPLTEAVALLRHPRLKLFEKRPLELRPAAGQVDGTLTIGFPLWNDLSMDQLQVRGTTKVTGGRLLGALAGQDLDRADVDLMIGTEGLKAQGQAVFLAAPVRLATEMNFRGGPPAQVLERASLVGRLDTASLAAFGLDAGPALSGKVGVEARLEKRRDGAAEVRVKTDLREAGFGGAGLGWEKPPGTPGSAEGILRLQGETLRAADGLRLDAPGLSLRGAARFGADGQLTAAEITEGRFAEGRFAGSLAPPEQAGGPWRLALQGPALDLGPLLEETARRAREAAPDARQPALATSLRFDRLLLGPGRDLYGVAGTAETDADGLLRQADLQGQTGARGEGAFTVQLRPDGAARRLSLRAADAGGLLGALDVTRAIGGGRLSVEAGYAETRPGAPLAGTAELDDFTLRDAPAAAKLLQVASVYGIPEALAAGRGLGFNKLIAPFVQTPEALRLEEVRAFSTSLGFTAQGTIWRKQQRLDLEGTIVPSYLLNSLLGHVPVLGKLFSPEKGGGLFAATWRLHGPTADPAVSVNPLAALTPGALRGLFKLGP